MTKKGNNIFSYILSWCLLSYGWAAHADNKSAQAEDIEQIEVTGKRPLNLLREEFTLAQHALFDNFNDLIEDPDMHYVCKREKRAGSNTKQKICRDAFDIRIRRELLQEQTTRPGDLMTNASYGMASAEMGSAEIDALKAKKIALMEKLYAENNEFRRTFVHMMKAKQRYEKSHKASFGVASKF
ncbi:hypothetical protein [Salinimonas chungwhensis]|uniref:hypothetical protein n=1 Tax=Salinimonas chungwhensis TaxID=265425 RepID=UPI00036AC8B8|nr:hypothetical protein [Salinimonas chungwhensis]